MEELTNESLKEGLAKGRAEGRAEGRRSNLLENVKKFMARGMSFDEVADTLELSQDDREFVQDNLWNNGGDTEHRRRRNKTGGQYIDWPPVFCRQPINYKIRSRIEALNFLKFNYGSLAQSREFTTSAFSTYDAENKRLFAFYCLANFFMLLVYNLIETLAKHVSTPNNLIKIATQSL